MKIGGFRQEGLDTPHLYGATLRRCHAEGIVGGEADLGCGWRAVLEKCMNAGVREPMLYFAI